MCDALVGGSDLDNRSPVVVQQYMREDKPLYEPALVGTSNWRSSEKAPREKLHINATGRWELKGMSVFSWGEKNMKTDPCQVFTMRL